MPQPMIGLVFTLHRHMSSATTPTVRRDQIDYGYTVSSNTQEKKKERKNIATLSLLV